MFRLMMLLAGLRGFLTSRPGKAMDTLLLRCGAEEDFAFPS